MDIDKYRLWFELQEASYPDETGIPMQECECPPRGTESE